MVVSSGKCIFVFIFWQSIEPSLKLLFLLREYIVRWALQLCSLPPAMVAFDTYGHLIPSTHQHATSRLLRTRSRSICCHWECHSNTYEDKQQNQLKGCSIVALRKNHDVVVEEGQGENHEADRLTLTLTSTLKLMIDDAGKFLLGFRAVSQEHTRDGETEMA